MALTLAWGLSLNSSSYGIDLVSHPLIGCGITRGNPVSLGGTIVPRVATYKSWPEIYTKTINEHLPQMVVLLVGRWEVADIFYNGRWTHIGEPDYDTYLLAELQLAIDILGSTGAKIVLLTTPHFSQNPSPTWVPESTPENLPSESEDAMYPENRPSRIDRFNNLLLQAKNRQPGFQKTVSIVDLGGKLSPQGSYAEVIDGIRIRKPDGIHITQACGQWLRPWLFSKLLNIHYEQHTSNTSCMSPPSQYSSQ